jgi:WD40 repeat protein/serine/threonine protein kinase
MHENPHNDPTLDSQRDERSVEDRLDDVIAGYLKAAEAGQAPDRQELLKRNPDLAPQLEEFFADRDRFDRLAEPVRAAVGPPPIGTRIRYFGDYELLEEIARGGMGVVFKARQVRLNRIVALKMILAGQLASQEDVRRFHSEAEAAAQLDHPGIVPIFEVGEHAGQHYFSMGFVDGQSLAATLSDGPLPPREAARLLVPVCDAVQYAHDRGVIHRDLKPANVLLSFDGKPEATVLQQNAFQGAVAFGLPLNDVVPKITDFGLAKRLKSASDLTGTGQIIGTPSYMPPEQAAGRLDQVKEMADVYALGAVLYATLTGRPPFQADNPLDTLMQVLEREPVSPRQLNPSVPRDLETICLKCLEKDRRRRYPSAQALAAELGRFLNGETILARPASTAERLVKWARRHPASAALVVVSVLATVLLAATGTYFVKRLAKERNDAVQARNDESIQRGKAEQAANDEAKARGIAVEEKKNAEVAKKIAEKERAEADAARTTAVAEKQKADAARSHAEQQRDRAEWLSYSAQLGKVQREWSNDQQSVRVARELLSACQWNRRGWEHDYWHTLLYHRGHRTVAPVGVAVHGVAISPDGKRIATVGNYSRIQVWDIETGAWLFDIPLATEGVVLSVAFSPDGTRLAARDKAGSAGMWSAATGEEIRMLSGHSFFVDQVAFSPDGTRLATHVPKRVRGKNDVQPGSLHVWSLETGKLITTVTEHGNGVLCFAWLPQGDRIASADGQGIVKVWDASDGHDVLSIEAHRGDRYKSISGLAVSPAGRLLATANFEGSIRLWNSEDGSLVRTLVGHTDMPTSVAFSADGKRLASGAKDTTARVWDVETGANVATYRGHTGEVRCVAFHPDGRRVASAAGEAVKLWEIDGLQSDKLLAAHAAAIGTVQASGDGKLLATAAADNTIKLWNVRSADQLELRATITCDPSLTRMRLSHDGRRIASVIRKSANPRDEEIRITDVETQQTLATLSGHDKHLLTALAISPDGEQIATGDASGGVQIRESRTGKSLHAFRSTWAYAGVTDLAFSPDGRWLAYSGGQDSMLRIFDCTTWREVHSLTPRSGFAVGGIDFSPDSRWIAASNEDRTVQMWDVTTGRELHSLRGHLDTAWALTFSPDGQRVVGGSGNEWHVWEATLGQHLLTFTDLVAGTRPAFIHQGQSLVSGRPDGQLQIRVASHRQNVLPLTGHSQGVNCVAYSPDGLVLATASDDMKIKLWDANNGIELRTLSGHQGAVTGLSFSSDGKLLASSSADKTVRLWEVETGGERAVLKGHTSVVTSVAFRPDGQRLVSGSYDHTIRVWDVATGQLAETWKDADKQVLCLAYSPDGRRVASSGYDFNVTLWDDATGKPVGRMTGNTEIVLDLAFSPDGRYIGSAAANQKVLLWDAATLQPIPSPTGFNGYVYAIAFSPDSRHVATAGMGRTVRVWDIAANRELIKFHGHDYTVMSVAFHPHGQQLTSAGLGPHRGDSLGPGQIRVWKIPPIDANKTVEVRRE